MKKIEHYMLPENTNRLYEEEAISSIGLTRDVADKINELVDAINNLSTTDLEWKQTQEGTIRKGVIFMKDNLANSLYELTNLLVKGGYFNTKLQEYTAELERQINTAISAVTIDSEVKDIRVGEDGVDYQTAGEAVREQLTNLRNYIDAYFTKSPNLFNKTDCVEGKAVSSSSLDVLTDNASTNASNIIPVDVLTEYVLTQANLGNGAKIFTYADNGAYAGQLTGQLQNDGTYKFTTLANTKFVRFSYSPIVFDVKTAMFCKLSELPSEYWNFGEVRLANTRDDSTYENYDGKEICIFNRGVCIGDSITEGTFNHNENGDNEYLSDARYSYPTYLTKLTGIPVDNYGRGGYTSAEYAAAYQNHDWSGYDFAIIKLGINDAIKGVPTSQTLEGINAIIESLKSYNKGIKIFVCTTTPAYSDGTDLYDGVNETIRTDVLNSWVNGDVYLIDLALRSKCKKGTAYEQGHLSAIGYYQMAKEIVSLVSYTIAQNLDNFTDVQFTNTTMSYT